jgi:hypothetical protein
MRGSIFSVSDKAMFDAVNQSKVTNAELKELFLSRGILTSTNTQRKDLATHFSMFTHSYFDYKRLSNLIGTNTRREKTTCTTISETIDKDVIEASISKITDTIVSQGARCESIISDDGKSYNLKIDYEDFNYGNSEFKQVTKKVATITLDIEEDGVTVRHPQNKTVEEWQALLIAEVEQQTGRELQTSRINLSHISDHNKVTDFFTAIINGIEGYKLKDVTDVYVYHPKEDEINEGESDDESDTITLGTHISKASLKGQNVLQSEVLRQFYQKEFYLSKIVWRSISVNSLIDGDIYEFEVQFSDPEEKDDFSYLAKGFYSYVSDGQYSKSRKALTTHQEQLFNKSIEHAAKQALLKIAGKGDE